MTLTERKERLQRALRADLETQIGCKYPSLVEEYDIGTSEGISEVKEIIYDRAVGLEGDVKSAVDNALTYCNEEYLWEVVDKATKIRDLIIHRKFIDARLKAIECIDTIESEDKISEIETKYRVPLAKLRRVTEAEIDIPQKLKDELEAEGYKLVRVG